MDLSSSYASSIDTHVYQVSLTDWYAYALVCPLWVMCGRLHFGKVYFGCKLVECCHVSGLLMRLFVPLALMRSAGVGSQSLARADSAP